MKKGRKTYTGGPLKKTASDNNSTSGNGNHGGYTSGKILLEKGTRFYVYVGQGLGCRNCSSFNGTTQSTGGGNAGGGATDIRLLSGNWNNLNSNP